MQSVRLEVKSSAQDEPNAARRLIASYNVWDLIGRYIPLIEQIKLRSRKGLLIAVVSRLLLVPAFYYTAKYADQGWMIMLTSFHGLSNGYLTVCVIRS